MGEAIEANADMALGEAFRPATIAHARVNPGEFGGTIIFGLIFAAGVVGGTIAGTLLGSWFPQLRDWLTTITGLVGIVTGLYFGLRYYARRQMSGFLAGLGTMGSPAVYPTRFVIDENGIRTENSRLSHNAAWAAVLFVITGPEHWLIQVDTITIALPHRAFADSAGEQTFLAFIQQRISDEARARSVFATH